MSKPKAGRDVGSQVLSQLEQDLSAEPRWVLRKDATATYWLSDLPLSVSYQPMRMLGEIPWVRVHASTVIGVDAEPSATTLEALAELNMLAVMSAAVLNAKRREISLHCQATFDAQRPIGGRYGAFRSAVLMQAAQAHYFKDELTLPSGRRPRVPHPSAGYRDGPSPLVRDAFAGLRQAAAGATNLLTEELAAIADTFERERMALFVVTGDGRLSMEVDAGSSTPRVWTSGVLNPDLPWDTTYADMLLEALRKAARETDTDPAVMHQVLWATIERLMDRPPATGALRITTADPHPWVGGGVLTLLLLPGKYRHEVACALANDLNSVEAAPDYSAPLTQFGGWSVRRTEVGSEIAYSGFLSSVILGDPGGNRVDMVTDLASEVGLRARPTMELVSARLAESGRGGD